MGIGRGLAAGGRNSLLQFIMPLSKDMNVIQLTVNHTVVVENNLFTLSMGCHAT